MSETYDADINEQKLSFLRELWVNRGTQTEQPGGRPTHDDSPEIKEERGN